MSMTLREGPIVWTQALTNCTADPGFPSGTTPSTTQVTFVTVPSGQSDGGRRIHVTYAQDTSLATTATVLLYGYGSAQSAWFYVGGFNGAASMTQDTSRWSNSTTNLQVAEHFDIPAHEAAGYTKFAVRPVSIGGGTAVINSYVGFARR